MRILEQFHYHCSHNPRYIQDIRNALRETGMLDESRTVQLKLKDSFKQTDFYGSEYVWLNERIKNSRDDVTGLDAYKIEGSFAYPNLMTGRVTEASAFGGGSLTLKPSCKEPVSREMKIANFGKTILGFAMDANDFFHFDNLRTYFPNLASASQFILSETYLGDVTVSVRGLPDDLDNLTARQKVDIARYVLHQIENGVKRESVEYVGTKDFKPHPIKDRFTDKTLTLRIEGETGKSWVKGETEVPGLEQIDLSGKDWHAYDDNYGTDQEKQFIRYLNDQADRLYDLYDEFFLLRNEKAVKLFAFDNGQAFEPDYVLFLRRKGSDVSAILQLFIEPKGHHLNQLDSWKETILKDVQHKGELKTVFQGRDYAVFGLPFFNESGQENTAFKAAFQKFMDD